MSLESRSLSRVRQTFLRTIKKYHLLEPGQRVLAAYSGGPDSSALVHLLLEIKKNWDLEIVLAHFNHRLRRSACRDEAFCRDTAGRLEIPILVGSDDVRSTARGRGLSLEEAARELRYEFLNKTALQIGASRIATGHTMNDQAETLLLRLVQGSGPQGLAGIHPAVEGRIVRPLLGITREDLEEYLLERGGEYIIDESNLNPRFLRNRIRLDLMPLLAEEFNPEIVRLLARTADILREEDAYLNKIAADKTEKAIPAGRRRTGLDAGYLASLPRALARRVVRNFIRQETGNLRSVSFDDVEDVLLLQEFKEKILGGDLALRREGGIVFRRDKNRSPSFFQYQWDGRKPLELPEATMILRGRRLKRARGPTFVFNDNRRAFLDLDKLSFPLEVRPRRPGDRYHPLGAPGSKKLKEALRSKGIALLRRDRLPVILSRGQIVWIPGLPVAENFKIDQKTKNVFLIERL
jgi:tRNA(Ile)-lysidine synthase